MLYPKKFEEKIEFIIIRDFLKSYCLSLLGKELVDSMKFEKDIDLIKKLINQTLEYCIILNEDNFPDLVIHDLRLTIKHLLIENSYLHTSELFELNKTLKSINAILFFLNKKNENNVDYKYPNLHLLSIDKGFDTNLYNIIDRILDENGSIKDNASPNLRKIRNEKLTVAKKISKILNTIILNAQKDGIVENNISPTVRDGRLVIPLSTSNKRKINGFIHDVSDSGKTVFIEPTQVVEANNEITELENEERKEILRILQTVSTEIRPHINDILSCYELLGWIDFIRAKAKFSILTNSVKPFIENYPLLDWKTAFHPILKLHIEKKNSEETHVVPLDIKLSYPNQRILIISGPNAGGKSVCLKTVGLLQYMLQCGMPIPLDENSKCGIFKDIFISIGDEQSIENELSTYSSYLNNMKAMMKYSTEDSLLLIDEFGGGTEPMIGGAMAQAILRQLNNKRVFGVITTHFQNLKQFAQETEGIVNAAMLYDRNEMRPLFQLRIGNPGSSFAIEIARKIGIPKDVIDETTQIVGNDYTSSEKYIQDIIRDKKYWETKRSEIHKKEKRLEETIDRYEQEMKKLREDKSNIINKAKNDANDILEKSNAIIERTIKEIKEAEADKKITLEARGKINTFKIDLNNLGNDDYEKKLQRKAEKIKRHQERKANSKRKDKTKADKNPQNTANNSQSDKIIKTGAFVKLIGQQTVGKVLKISGLNNALVAFGAVQMNVKLSNLELASKPNIEKRAFTFISRETQDNIRETTLNFKPEIDVRGMRGDEAVQAIKYFIDDAQIASVRQLRILHGTGSGILRSLIRQYLSTVSAVVSFKDEHPDFGGTGFTIVQLQ